eukprot:scaffold84028_cov36-Prasinocladus_malaysianus.AAC.1
MAWTHCRHLREWFEPFGNVVNARAVTNFGFVTFDDHETAQHVLDAVQQNPMVVDGYHLRLNWSKGSSGGAAADRQRGPPMGNRPGAFGRGNRDGGYARGPDPPWDPEPPAKQLDDLGSNAPGFGSQNEPTKVGGPANTRGQSDKEEAEDDKNRAAVVYDDL